MKRALSELAAVVQKAAIGAGIPVGQAEDLGRTARYMAACGHSLQPVIDALQEPLTPVDVAWGGEKLVIKSGHVALTAPIVKDGLATGIRKARINNPAHMTLVQATLAEAGQSVAIDGAIITKSDRPVPQPHKGPVDISDDQWAIFAEFAAKTFVPETARSRATGAGAGLTDND